MNSFEIPQDLRLAPIQTGAIRSFFEWVGSGWNAINRKDTTNNHLNYRKGKQMIGLGVVTTAALLTMTSCGSDEKPSTNNLAPIFANGPHCVFSNDIDPTATTTYVIQPNDGRESILFQIPGVNEDQCETSALAEVNSLNKGSGINLDTPRHGDTVVLPASAEFIAG